MSYAAERAAIESRWASMWVTGSPATPRTPTRYETVPGFDPPPTEPWVSLFILSGEARQASVGSPGDNFFRTASNITVQIFVPVLDAQGVPISPAAARRADDLADHAAAIFRGATFSGIRCRAPWKGPYSEDPPWLMAVVNVPIDRDSIF